MTAGVIPGVEPLTFFATYLQYGHDDLMQKELTRAKSGLEKI
jgi:hypothetical protein